MAQNLDCHNKELSFPSLLTCGWGHKIFRYASWSQSMMLDFYWLIENFRQVSSSWVSYIWKKLNCFKIVDVRLQFLPVSFRSRSASFSIRFYRNKLQAGDSTTFWTFLNPESSNLQTRTENGANLTMQLQKHFFLIHARIQLQSKNIDTFAPRKLWILSSVQNSIWHQARKTRVQIVFPTEWFIRKVK